MSKGQRTIASLVAVIAVLLFILSGRPQTPEAIAHANLAPPTRVIQVLQIDSVGVIFRLWSDGTIETTGYDLVGDLCAPEWCPWALVPDDVVPQPGTRIVQITGNVVLARASLVRVWSNGVIERNFSTIVLDWFEHNGLCIPSGEWCGWQVVPE